MTSYEFYKKNYKDVIHKAQDQQIKNQQHSQFWINKNA